MLDPRVELHGGKEQEEATAGSDVCELRPGPACLARAVSLGHWAAAVSGESSPPDISFLDEARKDCLLHALNCAWLNAARCFAAAAALGIADDELGNTSLGRLPRFPDPAVLGTGIGSPKEAAHRCLCILSRLSESSAAPS